MPKLEPIVNQEPKDQLVPTFNKKEVVEIVNKGIQEGEIEIPAGGTKLYKHSFVFNRNQSDSAFIVIISKSNQNLVENGALVKNISTLGTYMLGDESWAESAAKKVLSIINFDKPAYPSQKSIQVVQFTDSGAVKKEFAPTSVSEEIEEY